MLSSPSFDDVPKNTKIRQAFEKSKVYGAAVACYADDSRSLDGVIREHMKQENVAITPDASSVKVTVTTACAGVANATQAIVASSPAFVRNDISFIMIIVFTKGQHTVLATSTQDKSASLCSSDNQGLLGSFVGVVRRAILCRRGDVLRCRSA